MPTLSELKQRVQIIVQDYSSTIESSIASYINEGINVVAATVLLPALESSQEITTQSNAYEIDIPSAWNFDRNLYYVYSKTYENKIDIFSSVSLLLREFPTLYVGEDDGGQIKAVSIQSGKLIHFPKSAETLQCNFYQKPTLLSDDSDIPTCIPVHFQYKLLAHFAASEIFSLLEDGIIEGKTSTQFHMAQFYKALDDLDNFFRTGRSRPEPIRTSDWI